MTRVIGVTNKLASNMRLFMWEIDNSSLFDALEDANFLSQVFDIDIDILESSPRHYHLISYDVVTLETCERIQQWTAIKGDYLTVCELPLYDDKGLWNTLRVGKKFKSGSPIFVKRFIAEHNRHLKSEQHFKMYEFFCHVPPYPFGSPAQFVNLEAMISVYVTGIGTRKRLNANLWLE